MIFIVFLIGLVLGIPVAFSAILPVVVYHVLNNNSFMSIEFIARNTVKPLFTYVLVAIPAFLLSGRIMNNTGVTQRIFDFADSIVGRFRGGLVYTNVLASMFFASMSGTAVGDTGGLGQIELEMMRKAGYEDRFSAGITAASSVLGPIIPPSVAMVVLGGISGISIGRLFLGGIIPGLLMTLALMGAVYYRANFTIEGKSWPIGEKRSIVQVFQAFIRSFPALLTPFIILGGILLGVVTPTEAAVLAIDYALIIGLFYREIKIKNLWKTAEDVFVMTGVFMWLISTSGLLSWLLTREGLPQKIQFFFNSIYSSYGQGEILTLFIIAVALLLIGCFLDTTAAILLVTPILMPVVNNLGIDPVHFGVMMIVCLLIGIITPPFGICLFVMSDVANLPVREVTLEALKYLPAMLATLIFIILCPKLVLWLPNLFLK